MQDQEGSAGVHCKYHYHQGPSENLVRFWNGGSWADAELSYSPKYKKPSILDMPISSPPHALHRYSHLGVLTSTNILHIIPPPPTNLLIVVRKWTEHCGQLAQRKTYPSSDILIYSSALSTNHYRIINGSTSFCLHFLLQIIFKLSSSYPYHFVRARGCRLERQKSCWIVLAHYTNPHTTQIKLLSPRLHLHCQLFDKLALRGLAFSQGPDFRYHRSRFMVIYTLCIRFCEWAEYNVGLNTDNPYYFNPYSSRRGIQ